MLGVRWRRKRRGRVSWSALLEAKSVALFLVLSSLAHISLGYLGQSEGLRRALKQAVAV